MAELIPLEYRISVARKVLISRWIALGAVVVVGACVGLGYTYMWRKQQNDAYKHVQESYQQSALWLKAARDLQASRDALATNMQYMEKLQNDTVLLSLLNNVSEGLSPDDCLDAIRVEAHPENAKPGEVKYTVRIHGMTVSDTSHSKLLDRLTEIGKKAPVPMKVNLGEKHLNTVGVGEVTYFDLTCEQPAAKGG